MAAVDGLAIPFSSSDLNGVVSNDEVLIFFGRPAGYSQYSAAAMPAA